MTPVEFLRTISDETFVARMEAFTLDGPTGKKQKERLLKRLTPKMSEYPFIAPIVLGLPIIDRAIRDATDDRSLAVLLGVRDRQIGMLVMVEILLSLAEEACNAQDGG